MSQPGVMHEEDPLGPRVEIRGACRFTPERAQRGYRLNRFLTSMRQPAVRASFMDDPEGCMARQDLTDAERDMIRRRDYPAMLVYGASAVALGKASPALGTTLVERGAIGRQQTVAAFLAERKRANEGQPWQF